MPARRMARSLRAAPVAVVLAAASTGGAAASPVPVGADLVQNGSFENPDIPFGSWAIFASVPGWSHAPRPFTTSRGIEIMDHSNGNPATGAGDQFAELDSDGPSRVSQAIATAPGTTYRLEFLYSARPLAAAAQNHFAVSAGAASSEIGPLAGGSQTSWRSASLDFVADSASSEIAFLDLGPEESSSGGVGAYVDRVVVRRLNSPPDCSAVTASRTTLWPANNQLVEVALSGATDPDGDAVGLAITGVTQDEEVGESPDAAAAASPDATRLRAQRDGGGDGRVYSLAYTATDAYGGTCSGTVAVSVPHDQGGAAAVDSGQSHDSFGS